MPDEKAATLFAEIFADATPAAARIEQLNTLYASLLYMAPRKSMNTLLWQRHQVLLPQHAEAILAADPYAAKTAARLLSNSDWPSQIFDLAKLQKLNYCASYTGTMTPLMKQLPAKSQESYLLFALSNEPACAISSFLIGATVNPAAARQILSARIARESGETKVILQQALQAVR